ncbi:MAG: TolC family outer membrane protein [bacterium]
MARSIKRLGKQFAVCAVTAVAFSTTQQASAEDLWDIYQLALENDATYLAAASDYEAAKLNLPLAKTGFKPFVTTSGTLGRQRSDVSGPRTTSDAHQLNFDLDQPLYDRALSIEIDQAELGVEIAKIGFDIAHDNLTLRMAESYFTLLGLRDNKEVARLEKIAIKRQMDLAEERLDVGLGTRTDLFDARARFQKADADLISADISINNARQALIEIINVTPKSVAPLADGSPLELPEPNDLDHWVGLSQSNNLRVLAEDLNLMVASREIDRQRATRRPTVSVGASQRFTDSSATEFSDGDISTTSIGLNLNLPIYLGGSINLRTRQAGLQFNAVEQGLESIKRRAASDTTAAFLDVTSGISQVRALAEAIIAGENALQAKEEGFSAGLTTNLDVLDAQRDLSSSRTDFLQAKYTYILALLRLEQATGDLGEEDILYINEWLSK